MLLTSLDDGDDDDCKVDVLLLVPEDKFDELDAFPGMEDDKLSPFEDKVVEYLLPSLPPTPDDEDDDVP